MKPTQYEDINELLVSLLTQIQSVLEKKMIGLYLYGSLVWGDFDKEISDIDLLAVLSSDLNEKELNILKKMHAEFEDSHKEWWSRVEVQYISKQALQTF